MCVFSPPKIEVPDTPTPAPLPPPVESAPTVESVKFGQSENNTESASGIKGKNSKGKQSLQIKKKPTTTTKANTGVNYGN